MKTSHDIEPLLRSIDAAEAHVRSEYVRDLPGTMATVGASPNYALTAAPGVVSVISGRHGVAGFYAAAHEAAVPQASRFLTQITSDWYMFFENMPTREWIADGSLRTVHTATLLTTGSDGITGEFVWERPPAETGAAADTGALPIGSLRSVTFHEAFLAATCEGDRAALLALLDSNCAWAERDYLNEAEGGAILDLRGASATADHFAQWHRRYRPERVSILNRQATDWYVFAEELWIVRPGDGDRRQYRKAVIYPVNQDGKLAAAIGFGTDPEPPSSMADVCLGQAFWPEAEIDRRRRLQSRTRTPSPM
jgi:hypothetical protein